MKRHGFTLIELLVATVLASVLMLAVLTVMAGVARDRNVLQTIDRPVSTAVIDLLEADVRSAHTIARGPADDVVLSLVGNLGIDRASLRPDQRLVRVVYRRVGRGLWREQQYLDDPARPQVWSDLVSGDPCDVNLDVPLDDSPAAVPARVRLTVSTNGITQTREVTR